MVDKKDKHKIQYAQKYLKNFSKKLKKTLDKPFLFWYYSGVAFERPKNSGAFERGDLRDLDPSKKLEKSFKKLKKST